MHGRKPTKREKELIKKWHLDPENWLVEKSTPDLLTIQSRFSSKKRTIPEGLKSGRKRND